MKRIAAALVALVLVGSVVGAVEGATILVDDDGAQCPGALTTIQAGVDTAVAGDTVVVCGGEYFEEVTVDGTKTDVRVVGTGLVELKAPLLGISPAGFAVAADGVDIANFRISGFGQCGILVTGSRATIQGNEVHHNEFNICLQASAQSRVRNNVVHAATQLGISTTDGSENEISGNRVTGGAVGIAVFADSASAIHHNLVFGNDEAGIRLFIAQGSSIRNNTVRLPGAIGVVVFVAGDVQVVSNNVRDASLAGLAIDGCLACTVSRNSVNFNNLGLLPDGGGIVLVTMDASTISQNSAHRNGVVDCS